MKPEGDSNHSSGVQASAGSRFLLFFATVALIAVVGCGYHLARPGNNLPPGIREIAVPVLENDTMEPALEAALTDQLRRRFAESGFVRVVDVDDADAVLVGKVTKFKTSPISFAESEFAVEYRAQIRVAIRLVDRRGIVLWSDPALVKVREYRNQPNVFDAEASKQEAVEWLVREISAEVHDRVFDGFE